MPLPIFIIYATLSAFNPTPKPITPSAVLSHPGYTLEYAESYEQARWVSYTLTSYDANLNRARTDDFRPDSSIKTGSSTMADYKGGQYDRGHLKPAADSKATAETMHASFLMSNMSPQVPGFNRGIWENLEEQVRIWAEKYDSLYVVTGPVLGKGLTTIGPSKVAVPKRYFKALLVFTKKDTVMVGLLLPNEPSSKPLGSFMVPVDTIEKITGVNLFPELPDKVEKRLEAKVDTGKWVVGGGVVSCPAARFGVSP